MIASGGDTVQDIGGYRIHTFTTVGTSSLVVTRGGPVEVLVIAGGGGGGGNSAQSHPGGGGGAGELIYNPSFVISGTVSVTVGAGGAGEVITPFTNSLAGSNSSLGSLTANGGGRGGHQNENGGSGGSGGGGGRGFPPGGTTGGASTRTIGFGNAGGGSGSDLATNTASAGGGGGAGGTGRNSYDSSKATEGGPGFTYTISGSAITYAAGGSGGSRSDSLNGVSGAANTGSGGGGGGGSSGSYTSGGSGGSGIVIFRYPLGTLAAGPQPQIFLGPLLSYPASTGTPPTSDGTKVSFARGSSQFLNYGSQTFDMTRGFSVTCRFAFTSTVGNWERLIDFANGTNSDNILLTRRGSAGDVLFSYRNGGTEYSVISTNTVAQDQINTVTAIYNPSPLAVTIILNGVTTTSTPAVAATSPRTLSICYVGRSHWSGDAYLNGNIYSLNIYNRALTSSELVGPVAPSPWSTISYKYPLDTESTVIGAYSMRRLLSSYNGPMIKLRRQSDLALMDFVGDNFGNLSNVQTGQTVSSWIGGSSANVMIWYDQSSVANHAPYSTDTAYGLPPPFTLTDGIFFANQNFTTDTTYYYGLTFTTKKTIQACLCNFKLKSGKTNDQNWNSLVAAYNDNAGVRLSGNPGSLIIGDENDLLTYGCYTFFDGAYSSRTSNGPFFTNSYDIYHKMFANRTVGQYNPAANYEMFYIGIANPLYSLKNRSTYGYMNELVLFNGSVDPQNALKYLV